MRSAVDNGVWVKVKQVAKERQASMTSAMGACLLRVMAEWIVNKSESLHEA